MKYFCLIIVGTRLVVPVAFAQTVPMTNDGCSSPIPVFAGVNPSAPTGVAGHVFTNAGALEALSAGCPPMCGFGPNSDVWFTYTAAATGVHMIGTCTPLGLPAGSHADTIVQVLDGSVCPPVVVVGCNDDSCSLPELAAVATVSLVASTPYLIRVASWFGASDGTFYLSVTGPPPPVSNDDCTTPTTVFDGVNPGAPSGISGFTFDNAAATASVDVPFGCIASSKDVWFTYTATGSGLLNVKTCTPAGFAPGTLADSVLHVVDDACPANVTLACNDDACGTRSSVSVPVTQGTNYLIRVGSFGGGGAGGSFYLAIEFLAAPPSNDDCGGALAIFEGFNGPFDNGSATTSGVFITPAACAIGGVGHPGMNDVFFTYTAICDGAVEIATCDPAGFTGSNQDTQITVHDVVECPAPGIPPIACNDDAACGVGGYQSTVTFPVTAGMAYLVRVASWSAGGGTFGITVKRRTAAKAQVGPGCSAGGGPGPTLDIDGPPVLASMRALSIVGAAPNSSGIVFFGPPGPTSILAGGCTLFVPQAQLSVLLFFATAGDGTWTMAPDAVPSQPNYECVVVRLQGLVFPSSLSPQFQLTSGLDCTLGY